MIVFSVMHFIKMLKITGRKPKHQKKINFFASVSVRSVVTNNNEQ